MVDNQPASPNQGPREPGPLRRARRARPSHGGAVPHRASGHSTARLSSLALASLVSWAYAPIIDLSLSVYPVTESGLGGLVWAAAARALADAKSAVRNAACVAKFAT